jgi:hypothetical protein
MEKLDLSKAEHFLDEFYGKDFLLRLEKAGLIGNTLVVDPKTGILVHPTKMHQVIDTPWVHPKQHPEKNCELCHNILFPAFNFIPRMCLNCWKVVVRPRTVEELFKLYNLQVGLDEYCKCGIERGRPFVHALYGGYFYNDSQEQGQKRYEQVRKAVNEQISPDVSVILKRYCSEFEQKFGPSNKYERPADADMWEDMANKYIDIDFDPYEKQAELIVRHVMYLWLVFAFQHQDLTAIKFNHGEAFYPRVVEYQKEVPKQGKDILAAPQYTVYATKGGK